MAVGSRVRGESVKNANLMTVKEVAEYLHVSANYVYQNSSDLGGVKIGAALRFRREDIDRFVETHRIAPRKGRRPKEFKPW